MKSVLMVLSLLLLASLACSVRAKEDTTATDTPPLFSTATPPDTQNQSGQPTISITSPAANALVSVTGIQVKGQELGSFEHNVVVQALDAGGNVLEEQVTTSVGELGQLSDWEVTLTPDAEAGSEGTIYAFFTSPRDGSVAAEARIRVQYTN